MVKMKKKKEEQCTGKNSSLVQKNKKSGVVFILEKEIQFS